MPANWKALLYCQGQKLIREDCLGRIFIASWTNGPFELSEEGGEVKGSRVEFAEKRLILGQFYSTPLYSPSISLNPNKP